MKKEIHFISHSISDKFNSLFCKSEFTTAVKSNFDLYVLVSGQMVTVGKGIFEIDSCFSSIEMVTG